MRLLSFYIVIFLSLTILTLGCAFIPPLVGKKIDSDKIADGIYEGNYRNGPVKAVVEVKIENQKILKIELLKHIAWRGKKVEMIIPNRIIEEQSTRVDAVSGATISSYVIMNAVQKAIDEAVKAK